MKRSSAKRVFLGLTLALVGLIGLALGVFFFLAMAGITTVTSVFYAVLWWVVALSGPFMLLIGGALLALNLKPRVSATVGFVGAIMVSLWVGGIIGSAVIDAMYPSANPAIDSTIHPHDAIFYGVLAIACGIVDWAGYSALRLPR